MKLALLLLSFGLFLLFNNEEMSHTKKSMEIHILCTRVACFFSEMAKLRNDLIGETDTLNNHFLQKTGVKKK